MRERANMDTNASPSQVMSPSPTSPEAWGFPYQIGVCEKCDWLFLYPAGGQDQAPSAPACPHCFQARLSPVEPHSELAAQLRPPELWVPFSLSSTAFQQSLENFCSGIRFAPVDLTLENLRSRLQVVYLPVWLVDSQVQASWQADIGSNYQVVSHQDRFDDNRGGWSSKEIEETRVRWEPRLGRLSRSYQNVGAPALQANAVIMQKMGNFDFSKAQAYTPAKAFGGIPSGKGFVRLPDRGQVDAWPDAKPRFQQRAEEECQKASSGDHIREFKWSPDFQNQNWTLLLLPAYTTYYVDDDRSPHTLFIHGQTGHLSGLRRASMKRAQKTSLWIAIAGVLVFILSLLLTAAAALMPPLLAVGGVGLFIALVLILCAGIPLVMVWSTNRSLPETENIP